MSFLISSLSFGKGKLKEEGGYFTFAIILGELTGPKLVDLKL